MPKAQISLAKVLPPSFSRSSGLFHRTEPSPTSPTDVSSLAAFDSPKSQRRQRMSSDTRTLQALMSPCTIPLSCRKHSASATSRIWIFVSTCGDIAPVQTHCFLLIHLWILLHVRVERAVLDERGDHEETASHLQNTVAREYVLMNQVFPDRTLAKRSLHVSY